MYDKESSYKIMFCDPLAYADTYMPEKNNAEEILTNIAAFFEKKVGVNLHYWQSVLVPYVFLSSKAPFSENYGEYSTKAIIDCLETYSNQILQGSINVSEHFNHELNEIIKKLKELLDTQQEDTWNQITEIIDGLHLELDKNRDETRLLDDIIKLFSNRQIEKTRLLGEYIPKRHQIILYLGSIKKESKIEHTDFTTMMGMVLAHEFFHAMHCALEYPNPLWNSRSRATGLNKIQKTVVKEALADFFSVWWCFSSSYGDERMMEAVANYRFNSWKNNKYSSWPYAKALLLMKDINKQQTPDKLDTTGLDYGEMNLNHILLYDMGSNNNKVKDILRLN